MNKNELIEKIIARQVDKETVDGRMYNLGIREAARLVAESEISEAPTWFSTSDEIYPKQIGNKPRETIPCLVIYKGDILLRFWNFHYTCWDSEDKDDFFCNRDQVSHWMPAPDKPHQKKDISDHADYLLNWLKASESQNTTDMTERLGNGEET